MPVHVPARMPARHAPRLLLPDAPALALGARRGALFGADGDLEVLPHAELARRLDGQGVVLCHARSAERRLGVAFGRAFDVLELLAFVRPARFCVPTPRGLAAALDLQKKLEAILSGEPPHDIFIRWKPLHEQPIGWEPDINDGVRINIRPFIEAGVLRDKVNVKWTKDRGQEPQKLRPKADYPWFWDGATFVGDRVNDIRISVAQKQKAREAKGKA